jgi:TRAP transporter TAXI family solute receptor
MRAKTIFFCIVLSALIGSWGIMPAYSADKAFPKLVSLGTGGVGGAYNMVGVGAAKVWDKELGMKAKVAPGLALSNLRRFAKGRLDIIISPSSWGNAAYKGLEEFGFPEPIQNFRVLCHIYPSFFHYVALKKSGLRKISDLKGKHVGCGPKAATYDKIVGKRFEANGIKYFGDNPDMKKRFANWNDLARMLGDGNLDACIAGLSGLAPMPALQKLMEEKEIVALEWDKSVIENFKHPVFPTEVIKKELLPYLEKDHYCILGGVASIVVKQEFSDAFAYALIKSVHKNLQKLADDIPYFKYPLRYPEILTYDSSLPYHPGAIKYWKEVGVWNR